MSTYTFKRGVVRSPESWTVDAQGLSQENGQSSISWESVTEARFSDTPASNMNVLELVLKSESETLSLQCNERRRGESRRQFLHLSRAVTEQLESVNPDVKFMPSVGFQVLSWVIALLGLAAVCWGAYYIFIGISDWDRGGGFAVGMGTFAVLFGIFLAWCGSPWERPEPKSPAETREWIDRILAME